MNDASCLTARDCLGIGGTTRLRGYQNTVAVGSHYLASNVEFRTRPLEIFSTQLAAARAIRI